jgi:hypothetical protein
VCADGHQRAFAGRCEGRAEHQREEEEDRSS